MVEQRAGDLGNCPIPVRRGGLAAVREHGDSKPPTVGERDITDVVGNSAYGSGLVRYGRSLGQLTSIRFASESWIPGWGNVSASAISPTTYMSSGTSTFGRD